MLRFGFNMLVYFLTLVVGISCSYDTQEKIPVITYSKDYFPNSIGNEWVYDVFDSITNKEYEVKITIVKAVPFSPGVIAKMWKIKYPTRIDSLFVVEDNGTVKVYDWNKYSRADTYILPLNVGATWQGSWTYDLYRVEKQDSIIINNNHFKNGINILELGTAPNYKRTKNEWFIPYLGMARRYRYEYNLSLPDYKAWRIKSSNLH